MKPLIIGQAPARGNDGKPPFSGSSGSLLARLAGVGETGDVLPDHFDLRNLMQKYPGKQSKGDAFDKQMAKIAAFKLMDWLEHPSHQKRWVLLMGWNVAEAFGYNRRHHGYLVPWIWKQHTVVIFPHPSGVNRWYNSISNRLMAETMLKLALKNG